MELLKVYIDFPDMDICIAGSDGWSVDFYNLKNNLQLQYHPIPLIAHLDDGAYKRQSRKVPVGTYL